MNILFCEDYEKTLRFIFDFYDFDGDGKISKEDIRVVLSYVTIINENEIEKEKSMNINNNLNHNDKMNKKYKILYESSVKNQNQLFELLEKCFEKEGELIDYLSFANIIDNISSDIYFMIYIFLLEKKPFSFKSIELYQNIKNSPHKTHTDLNLPSLGFLFKENINNILINSHINKSLTPLKHNKNLSSATDHSIPYLDEKINYSPKEYVNYVESRGKIIKRNKLVKKINYIFDIGNNIDKTFLEVKIPENILEEINNVKYMDEEYEKYEKNDKQEIEIFESEKNNFEGYIYKFNRGKMMKIWFKLFYKDIFYYKKKEDKKHFGMHNLSGLFFIEEPEKNLQNEIY